LGFWFTHTYTYILLENIATKPHAHDISADIVRVWLFGYILQHIYIYIPPTPKALTFSFLALLGTRNGPATFGDGCEFVRETFADVDEKPPKLLAGE
jgi:hypothetical protein